jgi:hypothetical protein
MTSSTAMVVKRIAMRNTLGPHGVVRRLSSMSAPEPLLRTLVGRTEVPICRRNSRKSRVVGAHCVPIRGRSVHAAGRDRGLDVKQKSATCAGFGRSLRIAPALSAGGALGGRLVRTHRISRIHPADSESNVALGRSSGPIRTGFTGTDPLTIGDFRTCNRLALSAHGAYPWNESDRGSKAQRLFNKNSGNQMKFCTYPAQFGDAKCFSRSI